MKEKINNIIINIIYISLIILPICLISGPFISDFLISLVVISFIYYCFLNNEFKYFKNSFFFIFTFFYVWCLISAITSDYKLISSLKSFFYLRFFIFPLAVWFLFDQKKKIINYLLYSIFISLLILVIDGYIQYFTGESITGHKMKDARLSSLFGDELILGSYLCRFLPIIMALFFLSQYSRKKKLNIILSIFVILTSVIIFLSGERAAFLFVILTFFYLIFMPNKFSKYIVFLLTILIITISVFSINDKKISNRMFQQTLDQAGITKDLGNFSLEHKGHYLIAWDLFKKNKFFGVGPKNFWNNCNNILIYQKKPFVCTTHPHNTYLQLLSETGFVGFLTIFYLFLFLCFISIKHIYLKITKQLQYFNFPTICILASMLISLWPLIPTGSFFNNYINIIYFFPVGIFLWLNDEKKFF